jgi:hypothetical protein
MAATKTQAAPVNEAAIKTAVQTWAKAETSAIWELIRLVSRGLIGVSEVDRPKRILALKMWVNSAAEEAWGAGASKDRAAHISKIFTIAENATPKHYEQWAKNGTGFYKAYSEFAVPQRPKEKPAAPAGTAAVAAAAGTPGTGAPANGAAKELNVDDAAAVAATAKALEDAKTSGAVLGSAQYAKEKAAEGQPLDVPDPTEAWAARIDMDKTNWKRLLDQLSDKKRMILEPQMILAVMQAAAKKMPMFRNTISIMMQTSFIANEVVDFIKENPQMFDGISVDVEPAKEAKAS